jgi:hypothetical protein
MAPYPPELLSSGKNVHDQIDHRYESKVAKEGAPRKALIPLQTLRLGYMYILVKECCCPF